jgi:hypothetical protein
MKLVYNKVIVFFFFLRSAINVPSPLVEILTDKVPQQLKILGRRGIF